MRTIDEVLDAILDKAGGVFVVVDGALIESIDHALRGQNFQACPVFKETSEKEVLLAGPWLMTIGSDRPVLRRAVEMSASYNSGVCWVADCDTATMVRHLRKLNAARLPSMEFVYFRHYDPDVLSCVIPLFDEDQESIFFGPSRRVGLVSGDSAFATATLPQHRAARDQPGTITFSDAQMEVILQRQKRLSRLKIASILRDDFPGRFEQYNDNEMIAFVAANEANARKLGLQSEKSLYLWSHLSIATNHEVVTNPNFLQQLKAHNKGDMDKTLSRHIDDILFCYRNDVINRGVAR